MNDHDESGSSSFPSVRIWLCGPFRMEWVDRATGQASPLSEEALHGKDSTQVFALLKVLLCQPGRQAHRDWLMEQFWPEQAQSVAIHRFHNVTAAFRKLLSAPDGVPLLPSVSGRKNSTSIYTLSAYPRLWVDSDAILWNIEQAARMQRFGDDALPFWQRAFALLKRGPFLPDEPYAAWAHARRSELEGVYRSCVHALSRLSLAQYGDAGKAEALLLLQTYWQQHPTDEDALRPLLELLGEQGRFQEAEACYQECALALTELGQASDGQPRKPDARTHDLREYVRAKHIQRMRPVTHEQKPLLSLPFPRSLTSIRPFMDTSLIDVQGFPSFTLRYNTKENTETTYATQAQIPSLRQYQNRNTDMKRRELLQLLSSAGAAILLPFPDVDWERIQEGFVKPSWIDMTMLEDLEIINARLWNLYLNAPAKASVLDGVVGQLKTVLHLLRDSHPTSIHQRLCALSSDLAQLTGEIFFDMSDNVTAQSCYMFAAAAAKEGTAFDLWSTALVRHAFLPLYEEQYEDASHLLSEARKLSMRGQRSMATRFWVAAVEAEAFSGLGNLPACQNALERANDILTVQTQNPAWIRFDDTRLSALRGACYVRLQQPALAMPELQEALQQDQFKKPSRKRGLVLTDFAIASLQNGDIEQGCTHLQEVMDIVSQNSSSFLIEGVLKLRVQLEPFATLKVVKALDQRLQQSELLL